MKTYSISKLAGLFGLSRSTLLYYDKTGLLQAPERTETGYRVYTETEYQKLENICIFRDAGLPLSDIKRLLYTDAEPSAKILENRMLELGDQILQLRKQQHIIIEMLKNMTGKSYSPVVNKETWVKMLEAAGMDEAAMAKWHAEFETCAPEAHYELLLSLGIPEDEARQIQKWSRDIKHK